ncbi:TPA: amino acid transporter, partial [Corynebacterium striatum]|nr:amino acid transporter [Corynebacterium striatum]
VVASYLKLHPIMVANNELTTIRVIAYPVLPWATLLAMAALVVLMLFDPSARNQVIAVLVLTVFLVVASQFTKPRQVATETN